MNTQTQFIDLLKTIFQFNKNKIDLDFGVYKIFKYKENEIVDFIEKKLPAFIEEAVKDVGEYDIYRDVLNFFGRYYDQGDFYPTPVFSKNKHHIFRHNGEEIIFSWANKDQYYIKSVNSFQEYKIVDISVKNRKKAFKNVTNIKFLIDEIEEEKGTTKSGRAFVLSENKKPQVSDDGNSFLIYFDYKKSKTPVTLEALKKIFESEKIEIENLEFHFKKFNSLHKSDFFIHKNLDSFLTMELDYYIKTVVLDLDKLEVENDLLIKRAIAIKKIGAFIIEFLASMENLQKLLWEKKKFAYDVNYIITLDKIHLPLLRKIISHEKFNKQVEEWKSLGLIEKFPKNSFIDSKTKEIKEEYKYLPLDTAIFEDQDLTYSVLEHIEYLDDTIDSILVNSDNFHGINFLIEKFKKLIKCVYIDPPYNTETDRSNGTFPYKDGYPDSTWLSLLGSRIEASLPLLSDNAVIFSSIDDNEVDNLLKLYKSLGFDFVKLLPTIMNLKGNNDEYGFSGAHEYTICSIKNGKVDGAILELNVTEDDIIKWETDERGFFKKGATLKSSGENAPRTKRQNLYYPILFNKKTNKVESILFEEYGKIYNKENNTFNDNYIEELRTKYQKKDYVFLLPLDEKGSKLTWRWSFEKIQKESYDVIPVKTKTGVTLYKKQRPELKDFPTKKAKSFLYKPSYSSGNGTAELKELFNSKPFKSPKPLALVEDLISLGSTPESGYILDYFLGSGTTIHAAINQKRLKQDFKVIGIENGEYFDSLIIKRTKKAIYSDSWEEGKAQKPNGISQIVKYFKLEQYEDALENTVFNSSDYSAIKAFKDGLEPFKEYMTEHYQKSYLSLYEHFGKSHSQSLMMKIEDELLNKPFDFKLKIYEDGTIKEKTMDLVETFNALIGINVMSIKMRQYEGKRYVFVDSPDILVIWREFDNLKEVMQTEYKNKEMEFMKQEVDMNDKTIYMNGVCQTHSRIEFDAKETLFALREKLID